LFKLEGIESAECGSGIVNGTLIKAFFDVEEQENA